MGELIYLREILNQRELAKGRARDRESLERAVEILKQNLQATADQIAGAAAAEQPELLERAERLIAMIRYGLRMLGDDVEPGPRTLVRIK